MRPYTTSTTHFTPVQYFFGQFTVPITKYTTFASNFSYLKNHSKSETPQKILQTFYPCTIFIIVNLQSQSPNIPIFRPFFNIQKIIANQKYHKKFSNILGWYIFYPRTRLEAWFHWSGPPKREKNQNLPKICSLFQIFELCHSIWHS